MTADPRHLVRTTTTMSTDDLLANLPTDYTLTPPAPGLDVHTLQPGAQWGDDVPAYADPSHLAAWAHGFLAAQDHHDRKEN